MVYQMDGTRVGFVMKRCSTEQRDPRKRGCSLKYCTYHAGWLCHGKQCNLSRRHVLASGQWETTFGYMLLESQTSVHLHTIVTRTTRPILM